MKNTQLSYKIRKISAALEAQIAAVEAEMTRLARERGEVQSEFDKPVLERKPWLGPTLSKMLTLEQITWDLLGNVRTDLEGLRFRLVDLRYAAKQIGIAQHYIDELAIVEDTQIKLVTIAAKLIERLESQLKTTGVAKGELKGVEGRGVTVVLVPSIDMSDERAVEAAIEVQLANGPWQHLLDARKDETEGVREGDSETAG